MASYKTEAELVKMYVDKNPAKNEAAEDEEKILRELYGEPNEDGFYTGEGSDDE